MHRVQISLLLPLFVAFLALARGDSPQACADATALLPFVTKQIKRGTSLVVFQGAAVPQYACVAAGWSAQTQALEVDVKSADNVEELLRLAAPCPSQPHDYPCAAGIDASSVLVFAENSMLDSAVAQASAGAVRALPYGIFASLVSQDTFIRRVGGIRGDGADESGANMESAAYHTLNQNMFTDPDLRLEQLTWPTVLVNSAQHAAWLAQAAVDAWLNVVPFPYIMQARAVVNLHMPSSFAPVASNAMNRNGRFCTLAVLHLGKSQHEFSIKDDARFIEASWLFVDGAAVCLFSTRTFGFDHPSRDRIRSNFQRVFWNVMQQDRSPLPELSGCDNYVATDGQRLADLYGHLPGYWMHPSLVVATFEKNTTTWSGQPTDRLVKVRGVRTTKKLKAGKVIAQIPHNGGFFSREQLVKSASWPALQFLQEHHADPGMILDIGLAYEMMNSAKSTWKPLICNFPSAYDNFLQMQSLEELERATAEISVVNPGWNATQTVESFVNQLALFVEEGVALVSSLFPEIFPTGLPAKYYLHARMAKLSRTWTLNDSNGKHDIFSPSSDLFNHQEPSDVIISFHQADRVKKKGAVTVVEVQLLRNVSKGSEIFYCK